MTSLSADKAGNCTSGATMQRPPMALAPSPNNHTIAIQRLPCRITHGNERHLAATCAPIPSGAEVHMRYANTCKSKPQTQQGLPCKTMPRLPRAPNDQNNARRMRAIRSLETTHAKSQKAGGHDPGAQPHPTQLKQPGNTAQEQAGNRHVNEQGQLTRRKRPASLRASQTLRCWRSAILAPTSGNADMACSERP